MVRGLDNTKLKKKPWKTHLERDILYSQDIKDAYIQMGKAYGEIVKKTMDKSKKKKTN